MQNWCLEGKRCLKKQLFSCVWSILAFKVTLLKTETTPTKPRTAYVAGSCQAVITSRKSHYPPGLCACVRLPLFQISGHVSCLFFIAILPPHLRSPPCHRVLCCHLAALILARTLSVRCLKTVNEMYSVQALSIFVNWNGIKWIFIVTLFFSVNCEDRSKLWSVEPSQGFDHCMSWEDWSAC